MCHSDVEYNSQWSEILRLRLRVVSLVFSDEYLMPMTTVNDRQISYLCLLVMMALSRLVFQVLMI